MKISDIERYLHLRSGFELGLTTFNPDTDKEYSYFCEETREIVIKPNPFLNLKETINNLKEK